MLTDSILTFEDLGQGSYRQFQASQWRMNRREILPPPDRITGSAFAIVNHGRWIVPCPNTPCRNAIMASEADPFFACDNCGVGWFKIIFPVNKERIEALLLKRPMLGGLPVHRNWILSETPEDLQAQNKQRGII